MHKDHPIDKELQKVFLELALKSLEAAIILSQQGSEFTLDGSVYVALTNLQETVDNYVL
jgi:hypothetical protein